MQYKRHYLGFVDFGTEYTQHLYNCKIPGACSVGSGYQYGHAAGCKTGQSAYRPYGCG